MRPPTRLRACCGGATSAAAEHGLALIAAGHAPVARAARSRRSSDEPRYREFVAVRRRERAAAGRERAARPRRHARRGRVPARARGRRCRGFRSCSRCRRTRRTSPARRRASPRTARSARAAARAAGAPPRVRALRGVGGVRRAARRAIGLIADYTALWWDVRAHPALRHARDPHARPADRRRPAPAAFVALLQALCASRRSTCRAAVAEPGGRASTSRTAGRPRASARAPSSCTRTRRRASCAARELLELAGAGRRAARHRCSRARSRTRSRPTASSRSAARPGPRRRVRGPRRRAR